MPGHEPGTRKVRAQEFSKEEWEHRKEDIRKLWLDDDLTLLQCCSSLARNSRFKISARQLQKRIREWGFFKNNRKAIGRQSARPRNLQRPISSSNSDDAPSLNTPFEPPAASPSTSLTSVEESFNFGSSSSSAIRPEATTFVQSPFSPLSGGLPELQQSQTSPTFPVEPVLRPTKDVSIPIDPKFLDIRHIINGDTHKINSGEDLDMPEAPALPIERILPWQNTSTILPNRSGSLNESSPQGPILLDSQHQSSPAENTRRDSTVIQSMREWNLLRLHTLCIRPEALLKEIISSADSSGTDERCNNARRVYDDLRQSIRQNGMSSLQSIKCLNDMISHVGGWAPSDREGITTLAIELSLCLDDEHTPDRETRLVSLINYTDMLTDTGRSADALSFLTKVVERNETVLGMDHFRTFRARGVLANLHQKLGNWNKAYDLLLKTVESSRIEYGERDKRTIFYMNDALSNYGLAPPDISPEQTKQAEELQGRLLFLYFNDGTSPEDPSLLDSMSLMAVALGRQGQHEKARVVQERVYNGYLARRGESDRLTLCAKSSLAHTCLKLGRHDDAEKLGYDALRLAGVSLGVEDPEYLMLKSALGRTIHFRGRLHEAEQMQREIVQTSKETLGLRNPDTLLALSNLSMTLHDLGKVEEAEELEREALAGRETKLDPHHPERLISVINLCNILKNRGKKDEIREVFENYVPVIEGLSQERVILPEGAMQMVDFFKSEFSN